MDRQDRFWLKNYNNNSSKGYVLEVDFEYSKELLELHNKYHLAPDKIEMKKEMSKYQLMIVDFCNFSIDNVDKLVPNFFDKKSVWFIIKVFNFIWDLDCS